MPVPPRPRRPRSSPGARAGRGLHASIGALFTISGALFAFGAVGGPVAHAAPSLSTDILHSAGEAAGSLLCMEGFQFSSLLDLGPHGAGDSLRCGSAQGLGIAVLALAAVVVIALGKMRMSTESKRLDLARQLVEQGIEPPAELLMGPARGDLRKGVVLVFAGTGLFAAGLFAGDRGLSAGALVPEFIGLGYLVSFWLAARGRGDRGAR